VGAQARTDAAVQRMNVIALDPGVTTGLAWQTEDCVAFAELQQEHVLQFVWERLRDPEHRIDAVVCESFTITVQTAKKSQDGLVSIEIIGALRWMCALHGVRFQLQSPAVAKNFVDDAKLKRVGIYPTGLDHAKDAARHLVLFLYNQNVIEPGELIDEGNG
jgi:hypothetical protein